MGLHPWELAWREGRWKEVTPPLPAVQDFAAELKLANARVVLDLGSGAGRHALYLAKMGFVVAALDVSETALKTLQSHSRELDLHDVIIIKHEREVFFLPTEKVIGEQGQHRCKFCSLWKA